LYPAHRRISLVFESLFLTLFREKTYFLFLLVTRMAAPQDRVAALIEELAGLQIRSATIISELGAQHGGDQRPRRDKNVFVVGDRVRIVNTIRRPGNWNGEWNAQAREAYHQATVTRVAENKIFLLTSNDLRTWREPRNIRHEHPGRA